jgi:hypothetical protein
MYTESGADGNLTGGNLIVAIGHFG